MHTLCSNSCNFKRFIVRTINAFCLHKKVSMRGPNRSIHHVISLREGVIGPASTSGTP